MLKFCPISQQLISATYWNPKLLAELSIEFLAQATMLGLKKQKNKNKNKKQTNRNPVFDRSLDAYNCGFF